MKKILIFAILITGGFMLAENPLVVLNTNLGDITIELFIEEAPITVDNFLQYVEEGYYENTVFHRVISNFMVQGGGFGKDGKRKETREPIKNEADNGMKNLTGTVAMARTRVVDSATSQFFINVNDNTHLDHNPGNFGYCVFGKVVNGMDIVKKIENTPTVNKKGMGDYPVEDIVIKKAYVPDSRE